MLHRMSASPRASAGARRSPLAPLVIAALAALPGLASAQAAVHTLQVEQVGTGGGTVTVSPSCGSPCTFPDETVVTLTATPDERSTFDGFGLLTSISPCGLSAVCYLFMDEDLSVQATFTSSPVPTYPLTVVTSGTGKFDVRSNVGGIFCAPSCSGRIASGTQVTLSVRTFDTTFEGWSGPCSGLAPTCPFTMTGPETVEAAFTAIPIPPRTLTITKVGTGTGTVTVSPSCGSPCTFPDGSLVTLTFTPDAGSTFSLSGLRIDVYGSDGAGYGCSGNTCQVSMIGGDSSVRVTFTAESPPATPCADPIDFLYGSGSFGTTAARCYRTTMSVRGWGCSSFEGRTVSVNGGPATSACGAGPFPLPRAADGYTYFAISAGWYTWSTIYAWTW